MQCVRRTGRYYFRTTRLLVMLLATTVPLRTLHPEVGTRSGLFVLNLHVMIVKFPEALSLKKVRPTVLPLKGTVNVVTDSAPHGHIPGIVQFHFLGVLIESRKE